MLEPKDWHSFLTAEESAQLSKDTRAVLYFRARRRMIAKDRGSVRLPPPSARGTDHHAAKITPDIVRQIRSGHYKSDVQAATMLGLHPQTVRRVRRRELWAHIQ